MKAVKRFKNELFAVISAIVLLSFGFGYVSFADDKGINWTYEIDGNATDQGLTTAQGNRTVADIKALVGTSKKCMLVFKHTGSGVTKAFTFSSGVTLTDNFYLDIRPGAELVVNASSWIASPGHIIMAPNQRVLSTASTKSLYFTAEHLKYSAYNGGTTTVEIPSAKIDTLTLASGVGVNEFSNDTTLVGNSDLVVPTEKAVKTYVDTNIIAVSTYPTYYKHNLRIAPPSSGVSKTQVRVRADELTLSDLPGNKIILSGVSVTADITSAGSNGLEIGSTEAASTLYYIWVCKYDSGTTNFALLSTSGTTPLAIPTTAYKRLVGEVYNNASSDFNAIKRIGRTVTFAQPQNILENATIANTAFVAYALPVGVPANVEKLYMEVGTHAYGGRLEQVWATTGNNNGEWGVSAPGLYNTCAACAFSISGSYNMYHIELYDISGTTIYVKGNLTSGGPTGQEAWVLGYDLDR